MSTHPPPHPTPTPVSTGVSLSDVQVVELHDCFSTNELLTYEALGLCGEGEGGAMVEGGDNTYGGRFVVNPSGGLISKGHLLGATGDDVGGEEGREKL